MSKGKNPSLVVWTNPIKCLDGTPAEYVEQLGGNYRGRVNSCDALWHEAHWDKYGRYIGSDNTGLDKFRLNVVNV